MTSCEKFIKWESVAFIGKAPAGIADPCGNCGHPKDEHKRICGWEHESGAKCTKASHSESESHHNEIIGSWPVSGTGIPALYTAEVRICEASTLDPMGEVRVTGSAGFIAYVIREAGQAFEEDWAK